MYYFIIATLRVTKWASVLLIREWSLLLRLLYPWQFIKKCCSSSISFSFQSRYVLDSTGIDKPFLSYFSVCIHNEWTPCHYFVILILGAGFLIILTLLVSQSVSQSVSLTVGRSVGQSVTCWSAGQLVIQCILDVESS